VNAAKIWFPREQIERLRAIPLEEVLSLCGAKRDNSDKHKWHTPVGVLSITGPKFINWNSGAGGGGAIDLVMHLKNIDFIAAIEWLNCHRPSAFAPTPNRPSVAAKLQLPCPDPSKLWRVKTYLVRDRKIPGELIEALVQAGTLYADRKANAAFVLLGKEHQAVGAELRGTFKLRRWVGLAPGSKKDHGFFSVPAEPLLSVVLCESAIDAISCFTMYPHYRCISTAGARSDPPWLKGLLDQGCMVYCGFDSDETGDKMAEALTARYPAVKRLRPTNHDWNDALRGNKR
jgi:hypothetical protein